MSIGVFTVSKYENEDGGIHGIRIQPETLTLTLNGSANSAVAGDIDQISRAKVSGSRRSYGVHARTVTVRLTAAGASGSVGSLNTLPWLQESTFAAIKPDQTGTYNGSACIVVGKTAEKIK